MQLNTVVTLILVLVNLATFFAIALLCVLLFKHSDAGEALTISVPTLKTKKKEKRKPISRTEEEEYKLERERQNKAEWA